MSSREQEKDRRRRERAERAMAEQGADVRHRSCVWLDGSAPPVFCAEAAEDLAEDYEAVAFRGNPLSLWSIEDQFGTEHKVPVGKVLRISSTASE